MPVIAPWLLGMLKLGGAVAGFEGLMALIRRMGDDPAKALEAKTAHQQYALERAQGMLQEQQGVQKDYRRFKARYGDVDPEAMGAWAQVLATLERPRADGGPSQASVARTAQAIRGGLPSEVEPGAIGDALNALSGQPDLARRVAVGAALPVPLALRGYPTAATSEMIGADLPY